MTQLHSILNVRHGVMLVGPTGGGKTTVRNVLRHAMFLSEDVLHDENDTVQNKARNSIFDVNTCNPV